MYPHQYDDGEQAGLDAATNLINKAVSSSNDLWFWTGLCSGVMIGILLCGLAFMWSPLCV